MWECARRAGAIIRRLWQTGSLLKDIADWTYRLLSALGLPMAAVIAAILNQENLHIVLLYVMVAIVFAHYVLTQIRPDLDKLKELLTVDGYKRRLRCELEILIGNGNGLAGAALLYGGISPWRTPESEAAARAHQDRVSDWCTDVIDWLTKNRPDSVAEFEYQTDRGLGGTEWLSHRIERLIDIKRAI
jgi:hypothetical protein